MPTQRKAAYSKPRIRPAISDDAAFILSLVPRFAAFDLPKGRRKRDVVAVIRTDIGRTLRETPRSDHFFVARNANGQSIGFLHLQAQRDFFSGTRACHICNLAVIEDQEGQGIGRALLAHAQKWAHAHRCKLLTLSVFPGNARARALYEHAGFTTDLLRMAKPLQ